MPVVPAILGDDILVRSKGMAYGESLTYQFLCKRPLDLYRNNLTGTSVRAGNINFGSLRRYAEFSYQFIVIGTNVGDVEIDIFPVLQQ